MQYSTKRVLLTEFQDIQIDTKHTIGKLLFSDYYFKIKAKLKIINWILYLSYAIGIIVSSFAFIGQIDYKYQLFIILTLPHNIINVILILNIDILVLLLKTFEVLYTFANMLTAYCILAYLIPFDLITICYLTNACMMLVSILLMDAIPAKVRVIYSRLGVSLGLIYLISIELCILLNIIQIQDLSIQLMSIKFSMKAFLSTCLINIIIFSIKNIIMLIYKPTSLVNIKSRIYTSQITTRIIPL